MNRRLEESQRQAATIPERHVQELLTSAAGDARLVRADRLVVAMSGPLGTRCLHTYSAGPDKPEARLALLLSARLGNKQSRARRLGAAVLSFACGLVCGLAVMALLVVVARVG